MTMTRSTPVGATRTCPHCKAVILQSASVCPSCRKHLRFDPVADEPAPMPTFSPLRVEGSIRHPTEGQGWEYAIMVSITNERGEELVHRLVAVGAIPPGAQRTFKVAVEMYSPEDAKRPSP